MTAMDGNHREPPIGSEDVKASEADKHVESRDNPNPRHKRPGLLVGTTVVTGLVAFMLGLGLGLGVMALATPDQVRGVSQGTLPPNCQQQRWGFFGSQLRQICDGPIRPDGSWMRHRVVGFPSIMCTRTLAALVVATAATAPSTQAAGWTRWTRTTKPTWLPPTPCYPTSPGHLG